MRAWQLQQHGDPPDSLRLVEIDAPQPGPGEIRIRVAAAGLGLPDVFLCRGSYPLQPPIPFTPGQEVAGVVTAVGEGSHSVIGSRVMAVTAFLQGHGGFADQTLAPEGSAFRIPNEMGDEEAAAFLIPFHTAHVGLVRRGQLQAGENLLVHGGAGGTGSAAIQLGRALGARVIATAHGSEKLDACRHLGADVVIDYEAEDFPKAVMEATGGSGADVVYDPVGGEVFRRSLECVASQGRLLAIGFASGSFFDASTLELVFKNCSVVGVFVGAYGKELLSEGHEELLTLYEQGHIRPWVGREVPFDELPNALTKLASRQAMGRIVARL
jgi:NADPH2:quinone reductase